LGIIFVQGMTLAVFDYADQHALFSDYALSELSISSVVDEINRAQTTKGRQHFTEIVLHPTTDLSVIGRRKRIVQHLCLEENNALFFALQKELASIAASEKALEIYQNKDHRFHSDMRRLLPVNPMLKKAIAGSPLILELFYLLLFGDAGFGLIQQFGILGFVKELAFFIDGTTDSFDIVRAVSFGFGEFFKQHNIFQPQVAKTKSGEPYGLSKLIHTGYVNNIYHKLSSIMPRIFAVPLSIMPLLYYDIKLVETMSESYRNTSEIITLMQELQEYLVSLSGYFSAYRRLQELIKDSGIAEFALFQHAYEITKQPSVLKSLTMLQSSFDKKRNYLFYHGKALHLHLMMHDSVDMLRKTLDDIAELDTYVSLASLIFEQAKEKPFCFVEFIASSAEPTILADGAWMPLAKNPVKDHIVVSSDSSKILLTGPNGSGKSMYLKTIGVMVCLAQTFGIVPAVSCRMTPFSYVRTALDCKGDIEQGYSKFTQQNAMMKSFVDLAKSLGSSPKKALLLIDEAFSGTVEDEASKRIVQFMDTVEPIDNAIIVVSTHLKDPVYARSTGSRFRNYCMKVNVMHNGSDDTKTVRFGKVFRCEPGVLEWWFDDPYLRSQYIEQNG